MKDKISVFIPTYNRSIKLERTLIMINRYNKSNISVNVLDNNSTDNTREIIDSLKPTFSFDLIYHKNRCNIGLNANIIRCIEMCNTDWVWILGDDDSILEDCFETITECIASKPAENTCFVNFSTTAMQLRDTDIHATGISEFMSSMDSFPNTLFISSCLFNVKLISPYISFAYNYSYSLAPYLVCVLVALDKNNYGASFLKRKIVDFESVTDKAQKWSYFNLFLGLPSMFEVCGNVEAKVMRSFTSKIIQNVLLDKTLFVYILLYYHKSPFLRKYIYNQIVMRNIFYHPQRGLWLYLKVIFWGIIVNSNLLTGLYIKLRNIDVEKINMRFNIQPLHNRI